MARLNKRSPIFIYLFASLSLINHCLNLFALVVRARFCCGGGNRSDIFLQTNLFGHIASQSWRAFAGWHYYCLLSE